METREIKTSNASVTIFSDPFNSRLRVDDYNGELEEVLKIIQGQIESWGWVGKLIVKSRSQDRSFFVSKGFLPEAEVKAYFSGADMSFVVQYPISNRRKNSNEKLEQSILDQVFQSTDRYVPADLNQVKTATQSDVPRLAELYRECLEVYPTPISDSGYLLKTMLSGTIYMYIEEDGKIVSAASAEINSKYRNAELTDCATSEKAQGKGHIKKLLAKLEQRLHDDNINCLYTIARAESFGMNKAFYQLGYTYGGCLTNNCIISSGLEDMNVWHKLLH